MSVHASFTPDPTGAKPGKLGYYMPPEWHPHVATWLVWPKNEETWGEKLPEVEGIFLEMMTALSTGEQVRLLVDGPAARRKVEERLSVKRVGQAGIVFYEIPTVDSWIRDYGPNFLIRRGKMTGAAYNHWGFNAWGGKYDDLKADARIPEQLQPFLNLRRFEPPMILEGGAIDVNGKGVCLTTEDCLLHPNRNPGWTRAQTEACLRDFLGIRELVWLRSDIPGDDTDGHVDNVARFTDQDTIVCAVSGNRESLLDQNFQKLRGIARDSGKPFRVIALPLPEPIAASSHPLPASYLNFYISNAVVLAPIFNQKSDREAIDTLESLFPSREIRPIYCEPLIHGCGAIHCLTQQQPRTVAQ